jgi:hypothetical protein
MIAISTTPYVAAHISCSIDRLMRKHDRGLLLAAQQPQFEFSDPITQEEVVVNAQLAQGGVWQFVLMSNTPNQPPTIGVSWAITEVVLPPPPPPAHEPPTGTPMETQQTTDVFTISAESNTWNAMIENPSTIANASIFFRHVRGDGHCAVAQQPHSQWQYHCNVGCIGLTRCIR